jgi:hypothetical protein
MTYATWQLDRKNFSCARRHAPGAGHCGDAGNELDGTRESDDGRIRGGNLFRVLLFAFCGSALRSSDDCRYRGEPAAPDLDVISPLNPE